MATAQLIEVLHCGTTRTDPDKRRELRRQWKVLGISFSASAGCVGEAKNFGMHLCTQISRSSVSHI